MGVRILVGDCRDRLRELSDASVQCVVTSQPYFGLRDYGHEGQIGLEPTPDEFVAAMVEVFREVRRVLRDDGTLWLNLGDSYAAQRGGTHMPAETLAGGSGGKTKDGSRVNRSRHDGYNPTRNASAIGLKHKDLIGIPWRVAFALQADGWYLRQDIIWAKPNPMPESVRDRCTKAHEYIFLLTKSPRHFYDAEAVAEPAVSSHPAGNKTHKYADQYDAEKHLTQQHRTKAGLKALAGVEWETVNRRSVWSIGSRPFAEAHFATFPPELAETCIKAGSKPGDMVLDPFGGAGTTGLVADQLGRDCTLIELNPEYADMARRRIERDGGMFSQVEIAA